jgi:predicted N-acetyltransferase YhbS
MIEIRREEPKDINTVRNIHNAAFGQPAEGFIVDTLRKSCDEYISLVALITGQAVGHILFTPVTIGTAEGRNSPDYSSQN